MRRNSFFSLIVVSFLLLFTSVQFFSAPKSEALSGSQFVPGRIIDNTVFFNPVLMGSQEIQTFLNSKVPACDTWHTAGGGYSPPFTCLKDYSQNTPTMPADSYCPGTYTGGVYSSAQIIKKVADACTINPQVLLVLLQKEQSLITDTWPWQSQYDHATGYACPDTAACDPAYAGFFYQVYYAARQYQRYAKQSSLFNYKANQTNFILYNPNTACGGSNVYIENQATAGLYNYTPYQPNTAALSNLYGTGDGCSAYGNRNFWRLFNDWFGPTLRNLVKSNSTSAVYLVENGTKRSFPSGGIFLSYGYKWSDILTISDVELASIPNGPNMQFRNGLPIKSAASSAVYLTENGTKRVFPSGDIFISYSYKWADIMVISDGELLSIPSGPNMQYNLQYRNGQLVKPASSSVVYLVENGTKRVFPSGSIFSSYGYKWADILTISDAELASIPNGSSMQYKIGTLVKSNSTSAVYLVENGTKRVFPSGSIFSSYIYSSYPYKWSNIMTIGDVEMASIPNGSSVTHFREGKLIKVASSSAVYLVENGTKRVFPSGSIFSSYGYKWADILTISDSELASIPNGLAMTLKI